MAGGGIVHQLGHNERMDPVATLLIDGAVIFVPGLHPARRRAQNHAGPFAQIPFEPQARLRHRFGGGQKCKLREAIIQDDLLAVEVLFRAIVFDLRTDLDAEPVNIGKVHRPDCAAPVSHRGLRFGDIGAKRINGAGARDHDATRHFWSRIRSLTPAMMA